MILFHLYNIISFLYNQSKRLKLQEYGQFNRFAVKKYGNFLIFLLTKPNRCVIMK